MGQQIHHLRHHWQKYLAATDKKWLHTQKPLQWGMSPTIFSIWWSESLVICKFELEQKDAVENCTSDKNKNNQFWHLPNWYSLPLHTCPKVIRWLCDSISICFRCDWCHKRLTMGWCCELLWMADVKSLCVIVVTHADLLTHRSMVFCSVQIQYFQQHVSGLCHSMCQHSCSLKMYISSTESNENRQNFLLPTLCA